MLRFIVTVLLTAVLLTGCSRNPFGTVRVTGIVCLDGKPIDAVTVSFQSADGSLMGAVGRTQADGAFVLTTGGAPFGSGAVPGQYSVLFSKTDVPEKYRTGTTEEFMEKFGSKTIDIPLIFIVPERYGSAAETDIAPVTVEKRGRNHFVFDLSAQKK